MAVRASLANPVLDELADVIRNVVRLDKANRELETKLIVRTQELAEALAREDELEREYALLKARYEAAGRQRR